MVGKAEKPTELAFTTVKTYANASGKYEVHLYLDIDQEGMIVPTKFEPVAERPPDSAYMFSMFKVKSPAKPRPKSIEYSQVDSDGSSDEETA